MKHERIFLVGPMGAGKTTIGKLLARMRGLTFLDSDQVIEERTGADIAWIFDVEGEAGFRKREAAVIDELTQLRGVLVSTGGGAVLDPDTRRRLSSRGIVVFLDTTIERQLARTRQDHTRPMLAAGDRRAVLERLQSERDPLYVEVADVTVMSRDQGARVLAQEISRRIDALAATAGIGDQWTP